MKLLVCAEKQHHFSSLIFFQGDVGSAVKKIPKIMWMKNLSFNGTSNFELWILNISITTIRPGGQRNWWEIGGIFANIVCTYGPSADPALFHKKIMQQWETRFHCVWSVVGWFIVYCMCILSLSCNLHSHTICWR